MARDAFSKTLAELSSASPFPFALQEKRGLLLNLCADSDLLTQTDPANANAFEGWIRGKLESTGADFAVGGYGEDRTLYRISDLFGAASEEPRTVHLGVDFWLPSGTPVHAVLPGVVHSTRDNKAFGDYGPTVIMMHELGGHRFYTLYGHLARPSLIGSPPGRRVEAGEQIGWVGETHENVGWPPHLHFQVIRDLEGREGDYPGVCKASERTVWLARCPDPNLLFRLDLLKPRRKRTSSKLASKNLPPKRGAKRGVERGADRGVKGPVRVAPIRAGGKRV